MPYEHLIGTVGEVVVDFARSFGLTASDCMDVWAMIGKGPEGPDEKVMAMLEAIAGLLRSAGDE